jgi:hypothetical protein
MGNVTRATTTPKFSQQFCGFAARESKSERGAIGLMNFPRAEKWPPVDIIPEWRLEMASKFIFLLPVKKLWFYRNLK